MYMEVCWWLVPLWISGVSAEGDSPWSCPQHCECPGEFLLVNCSSRQLSSVPEGINGSTRSLSLADNLLKTLGRHQFSDLGQLQELDVSQNEITAIEVEAFVGLQNLLTLWISQNRLKIVLVGAFSGLQSLRVLDISRNEILVFLNDMFCEMPSLQTLEARENDLVFISGRAFRGLQSLRELNLDGHNVTSVPSAALSQLTSLTKLSFCHARLTTLPNNSFRWLSQLRELTVCHWPWLDSLAPKSLTGLNLTSLTISYGSLNSVPYASLCHLVYLRYLDLSYNPITSIQAGLLGDLVRLREFNLVGGSLLTVEPGAFRGLLHLSLLNMSFNQLSTLEATAFQSVGTLQVLRLDGNPLACDCRLYWVLHRRPQLHFDSQSPGCFSPVQVRGRRFTDFKESELSGVFVCRQVRILSRMPQEVRADKGRSVRFQCQADGEPAPSVIWVSPQRTLLSNTSRINVLANGTLEIRHVQAEDSGYYRCFASNVAGNDSISVSLRVGNVPASASPSRNLSAYFFLEGWSPAPTQLPLNVTQEDPQPFQLDLKTLLVAIMMGFLSFLSSVAVCFVFMLLWSRSRGKIKHTATIDFVPHSAAKGSSGGRTRMETGRFTMKLI